MSRDLASLAAPPRVALAAALNLVLPGGGLILLDATWMGLLFGAAFITLLNLALLATFVTPDDFARSGQFAALAAVTLSYIAAQVGLANQLREFREETALAARRETLREVERLSGGGDAAAALALIEPLGARHPDDLAISHWRAALLTALGRRAEARTAWTHLRRLDRHGIYRDVVRANL